MKVVGRQIVDCLPLVDDYGAGFSAALRHPPPYLSPSIIPANGCVEEVVLIPPQRVWLVSGFHEGSTALNPGILLVLQVLREILKLAVEVPAKAIQIVGDRIRTGLIGDL